MSFNKITVVGFLGKDPELSYTSNGVAVANFDIGVNAQTGKDTITTQWYRISVWRQQAENCAKYLQKGSQVYVDGTLSVQEWKSKDGENKYTLNVIANTVQFLSSKSLDDSVGAPKRKGPPAVDQGTDPNEIPF